MYNPGLLSERFWVYMYIHTVYEVQEALRMLGGSKQILSEDVHSQPRLHSIPTDRIQLSMSSQSKIYKYKPKKGK